MTSLEILTNILTLAIPKGARHTDDGKDSNAFMATSRKRCFKVQVARMGRYGYGLSGHVHRHLPGDYGQLWAHSDHEVT